MINQNEVVKAFGTINRPVKCLGDGSWCNLDVYTNRYLHARELARQPAAFNLQNAEPQIRLGFSGARGNDYNGDAIVNTTMINYVFSRKILKIDGQMGLSVEF